MYRLKKLAQNIYQIHSQTDAYQGTLQGIQLVADDMGINKEEFSTALCEMVDRGHDYAEFGSRGYFIFTGTNKR